MPEYTQTNRPLAVTTPLGPNVLLLTAFAGHEAISQLFSFQLDLIAENNRDVTFDRLLGQKLTVELALPAGGKRYFNGLCNRVSQSGRNVEFTGYQVELVPELWLWSKRAQSRIFQHLSVPDILRRVLEGLDVVYELRGTFQPRNFCVQYRETDFNFASRLMEEEGIYYFFKHTASGHQMVVANTPQGHPDVPSRNTLRYSASNGGNAPDDHIYDWQKVQELRSGKYTLWDHRFELPHRHLEADKTILESVAVGQVTHQLRVGSNGRLELYDWPGEYAQRFDGVDRGGGDRAADLDKIFEDNRRTVEIRMQEEALPSLAIRGASGCRQLTAGHKLTLQGHFNADGAYVLTSVQHRATNASYRSGAQGGFTYHNSFTCIPFGLPYRPLRLTPKPVVPGTQTAVVVGPSGQELFTDKYGRVKVQFHWDREGRNNADSSCWVRVAQLWAGKRWGTSFWPRIGQEVVVDFLEGDPDQPIIVGSVYNADQMPPYLGDGPDDKHENDNKVSGVKSNTTTGGVGYNEWRFDDTKDKEQIFIHAERNMDTRVKKDCMEGVGGSRHLSVGGDQNEQVGGKKNLTVKKDHAEKIEGNMLLLVGDKGGNQDIVIEKAKKELIGTDDHLHVKGKQAAQVDGTQDLTVKGDKKELLQSDSHLHVKMNRNEKIDMTQSLTVGMDQHEKVGMNHALEAGMEIHLKAGMKVIIEAGVQLSLKGPGGFVDIGPAGVTIQGIMVLINSGGAAGSGSGAKPEAPKDAQAPEDAKKAEPTEPTKADDAKSGQKSAP